MRAYDEAPSLLTHTERPSSPAARPKPPRQMPLTPRRPLQMPFLSVSTLPSLLSVSLSVSLSHSSFSCPYIFWFLTPRRPFQMPFRGDPEATLCPPPKGIGRSPPPRLPTAPLASPFPTLK